MPEHHMAPPASLVPEGRDLTPLEGGWPLCGLLFASYGKTEHLRSVIQNLGMDPGRVVPREELFFPGGHRQSSLLSQKQGVWLSSPCTFFCIFFWRARVCRPLLCLCRPFMILEGCLDLNPEYCRSNLARYRLSHPSLTDLATHPQS